MPDDGVCCMDAAVPFGPTGEVVYQRTYSREKADGTRETWPDTVERVAAGNIALVHGKDRSRWSGATQSEFQRLREYMLRFALLPAGRHLWATGADSRQHLFNCHVAGWGNYLAEHYEFSFMRLMEGGGVGANYSTKYISRFGVPRRPVNAWITCDPNHPDIAELEPELAAPSIRPSTGWQYDQNEPYILRYSPGDSNMLVDDSREGWAEALVDLISTAMSDSHPEGLLVRVYDVGGVRQSGSKLNTFGGTASGPAPFARMMHEVAKVLNGAHERGVLTPMDAMLIDHAIAECVVSGGNRRSARMSIVHWNDPYIYDFINCKSDTGLHWTTNISVEIDDEFLRLLEQGSYSAWTIHNEVCKAALANGEPGYWNSSLSNEGEIEEVIATNPCGEIPLTPWENCNLGHVNLDYFAHRPWTELAEAHRLMTRFLMRATYGDVNDGRQAKVLAKNRRIGVGHLGVQGYWAKKGVRYSDIASEAPGFLQRLYHVVRTEARDYAFQLRIPEPVKVTTVAPTGSVAKLPGVSEGIHPVYSRHFERRVRFSMRDEAQFETVAQAMAKGFEVEDDQYDSTGMTKIVVYPTEDILLSQVRYLGFDDSVVQSADELTVRQMLSVQRVYQKFWADNAVSYTVNIPEGKVTEQELAVILAEFLPDLKGTTVMVDASRPQAPYTRITREQYESAVATTVEDSTDEACRNGACPVR